VAPAMQTGGKGVPLFKDGIEQGAGMTAKYIGFPFKAPRPDTPAFDGTWVNNHAFSPLQSSRWSVVALRDLSANVIRSATWALTPWESPPGLMFGGSARRSSNMAESACLQPLA